MELMRCADIHPIRYTNLARLLADFKGAVATGSDVVYFSGVPKDLFETGIRRARDRGKLQHRKARLTYIASGLLVVAMPSKRHEVAQMRLCLYLQQQAGQMGLKKVLPGGASSSVAASGSTSEPDGCFFGNGFSSNPTTVIEVAASQSALTIKGAIWCTVPGVKAVLLCNIQAEKRTITITKVVPTLQDNRTRSGLKLCPKVVARIVVRSVEGAPGVYELDPELDQAITLALGDVTDEAAPAGGEPDFVFSKAILQGWADVVLSV